MTTQNNNSRNIDPEKVTAERLNGYAALFGCIALVLSLIHISAFIMTPEAEKFNGWAAMLGFVAAFGAYATTGQIIPGIF